MMIVSFLLTIYQQKQLVMPKTQEAPIAAISQFQVESIGSNIEVDNPLAVGVYRKTTDEKRLVDQAVLDLGHGKNTDSTKVNEIDNTIKIKFTAYINDHANVTQGASFWIGAGVIGRPKMVWVGQFKIITTLSTPSIPFPSMDLSFSGET